MLTKLLYIFQLLKKSIEQFFKIHLEDIEIERNDSKNDYSA